MARIVVRTGEIIYTLRAPNPPEQQVQNIPDQEPVDLFHSRPVFAGPCHQDGSMNVRKLVGFVTVDSYAMEVLRAPVGCWRRASFQQLCLRCITSVWQKKALDM